MTPPMVPAMRVRPSWPLPASVAVWSATAEISVIVLTSSLEVAEISRDVALISVVVAEISLAVACCCLAVAAMSTADRSTWPPDRCISPTSADNRSTMLARALPSTSRSDRGLTTTARSPAAMRSATPAISFEAVTIWSNAWPSTPISSLRDFDAPGIARSPMAIWLAALTTRPSESVRSRIAKRPMTDTTSKPSAAHASVCNTSERNVATRSISSAMQRGRDVGFHLEDRVHTLGQGGEVIRRARLCALLCQRDHRDHRLEDRVAAEIGVTLERRPEGLVRLKRLAHRLVHLAGEELHQNGVPIQPSSIDRVSGSCVAATVMPKPRASASASLNSGPWLMSTSIRCFLSRSGSRVRLDTSPTCAINAMTPAITFECRVALSSADRLVALCPGDRGSRRARPSISLSCATHHPAAGRLRLPS